ncbi:uncharacterized protein [Nicotiana tomentosiformis]|uniref:uncharacterized protein n=1 Tax=Nicotiana tomentosiformis TaxID=4098 RepID=UPI00388C5C57
MGSLIHIEAGRKGLTKELHQLANMRIRLLDSDDGGVTVHNTAESSLVAEALYGRRCRSPVGWFKVGERELYGPDFVHQAIKKVKVIQEQLRTAQSRQKSYSDVRRRDMEFEVVDWVFLKISPMKGVMHFGKKGKLSPRYIGPYIILRRIRQVAYELELPSELEFLYVVFHVSMLRKCIGDPSRVVPIKDVQLTEDLSYDEVPVDILDRQVSKQRTKDVASVKVLWRNKNIEEITWEAEEKMKSKYPYLFQSEDNEDAWGKQDTIQGKTTL